MTGLLHALMHTKGCAIIECDHKSGRRFFSKVPSAQPEYTVILWQCIFQARQRIINLGYGQLRIEWIKAHLAADVAVSQGLCPAKWLANATADIYADTVAAHFQVSTAQLSEFRTHADQSVQILKRLVAIAVKLAPSARAASRIVGGAS